MARQRRTQHLFCNQIFESLFSVRLDILPIPSRQRTLRTDIRPAGQHDAASGFISFPKLLDVWTPDFQLLNNSQQLKFLLNNKCNNHKGQKTLLNNKCSIHKGHANRTCPL